MLDAPTAAEASLIGSLPVDLASLEQALDRCLDQLDANGDSLAELLASDGAGPWLTVAMAASAAGAPARYVRRKTRTAARALAKVNGGGTNSLWFPGPFVCE